MRKKITHEYLLVILDYNSVTGNFTWKIQKSPRAIIGNIAGTNTVKGYLHIRIDGQIYLGHVLAWFYMTGDWPDNLVDHKNNDPADNSWNNLRQATHSENNANRMVRGDNKLGVKGVSRTASGKYAAFISILGKRKGLGSFDTIELASEAYRVSATKNYQEFARF